MIGVTVGVIASCLAPGGACGENRAMTVTPPSTPVCRTDRVTRRLSRDYGVVRKGPVEVGAFRGPTAVMYGGVTRLGPPMRDTRKRILKFNLTLQRNWGAPATFRIVRVDTGRPAYWSGPRGDDRYTGYAVRLAKRPERSPVCVRASSCPGRAATGSRCDPTARSSASISWCPTHGNHCHRTGHLRRPDAQPPGHGPGGTRARLVPQLRCADQSHRAASPCGENRSAPGAGQRRVTVRLNGHWMA